MPSPDMVPHVDLSPGGAELLVVDGFRGAPPRGPIWSLPMLGGSPRRLGDALGETAAWSPDGKMLAYSNLSDLFVAKADGDGSAQAAYREGRHQECGHGRPTTATCDSIPLRERGNHQAAAYVGSISVGFGDGLASDLLAGWHDPPDECCGKWTADAKYFVFQSKKSDLGSCRGKERLSAFRTETRLHGDFRARCRCRIRFPAKMEKNCS